MNVRDDLPPEERDAYDAAYAASYAGAVDRLEREWLTVKQAIYDALPPIVQRFFVRPEVE